MSQVGAAVTSARDPGQHPARTGKKESGADIHSKMDYGVKNKYFPLIFNSYLHYKRKTSICPPVSWSLLS